MERHSRLEVKTRRCGFGVWRTVTVGEPLPNPNAGVRCLAPPATKSPRLPAKMRMKKGEAIMKGLWMKASPGRSSTRWIKPPGQPQSRIKKDIELNLKLLSEDFMKRKIP